MNVSQCKLHHTKYRCEPILYSILLLHIYMYFCCSRRRNPPHFGLFFSLERMKFNRWSKKKYNPKPTTNLSWNWNIKCGKRKVIKYVLWFHVNQSIQVEWRAIPEKNRSKLNGIELIWVRSKSQSFGQSNNRAMTTMMTIIDRQNAINVWTCRWENENQIVPSN